MAAYDDMLQAGVVEGEAFATAVNSHQGLGSLGHNKSSHEKDLRIYRTGPQESKV